MCLYLYALGGGGGGITVACDLSVIWLLQRPQEIRLAVMEQPRKQLFPDAFRPGGRVGGCCKKHTHTHTQLVGESAGVVREHTHTHADKSSWWTDVAHLWIGHDKHVAVKQVVRRRSAHRADI